MNEIDQYIPLFVLYEIWNHVFQNKKKKKYILQVGYFIIVTYDNNIDSFTPKENSTRWTKLETTLNLPVALLLTLFFFFLRNNKTKSIGVGLT